MIDADLRARVDAWLTLDPDPGDRAEIERLLAAAADDASSAAAELADRFAGRLTFGTSGLRAEMGAGPRRMNRLVVRQTAAGLLRWLHGRQPEDAGARVVIGYDARHRSADFAADTARVVAAAGGEALLLPRPTPTPVLAFAVRHLGATAGVMCTASHNPRNDNGYKVYLADGAQVIPPADAAIAAAVDDVVAAGGAVALAAVDDPRIEHLGDEVVDAYRAHVDGLALVPRTAPGRDLVIVHTALHGVAGDLAAALFAARGFTGLHPVAAQAEPDPEFPTAPHPNPEEGGALALALADAAQRGADLVLANDPDGDRLGVAVPDRAGAGWRALTGNEIGALLCEHVLSRTSGHDRLVVTTVASSRLLAAIAGHHGVRHDETLPGFKWIVRPGLATPDRRFVFGCEEALGYSVDEYIRDKDGLAAAVAFADLVASLRAEGRTVDDALEALSRRHGHHESRTWSVRLGGLGAPARTRAVTDCWRSRPPVSLAGRAVTAVRDLASGDDLPSTDALVVEAEGRARVVLRPSGTEPKAKVYVEVVVPVATGPEGYAEARAAGAAAVEDVRAAVAEAHAL